MAKAKKSSPERRAKQPDDKLVSKLAHKTPRYLQKALILTGKPFYYLFSVTLIALAFIAYSVGNATRHIFITLIVNSFILVKFVKDIFIHSYKYIIGRQSTSRKIYSKNTRELKKSFTSKKNRFAQVIILKKRNVYLSLKKARKRLKIGPHYLNIQTGLKKPITAIHYSLKTFINYSILKTHLLVLRLSRLRFLPHKPRIRIRYIILVALILFIIISPFVALSIILKDLPSVHNLTNRHIDMSTKIYDRNGLLLYKIYKDENRTVIPIEDIPPEIIYATLAAEDAEFYTHPGISAKGMARSFYKNFRDGELTGGSTITQQLVKNALLSPEKTINRKIREIVLAIQVETTFTKDEILEMYLNEVSYGSTAYGIQEAAWYYFAKDAKDLNLGEAALLAGLPKGPTARSPFGPTPEEGIVRQNEILRLMQAKGFIDDKSLEKYLNKDLTFAPNRTEILAPHFVMYTRQLLEDRFGKEMVETGGLEVTTTLDYTTQMIAEKIVKDELENLKNLKVGNAAVIVMNPKTGEILAMVGSKDYFNTNDNGNVNATTALRQPGSSIKLVNYAFALSGGMTPTTIIDDAPVTFNTPGSEPYSPKNYDDKFRGKLTLRSALAESRNIPAVKVLAAYGVDNMIKMGQAMGITSWNEPSRFGLSLTLGGGEVKLVDLARVYATVANYGMKPELQSFLSVANYKGKLIENNDCDAKQDEVLKIVSPVNSVLANENLTDFKDLLDKDCKTTQVLDPRVAYILTDILRDNTARSPAFGSHSQLVVSGHPEVAVKTGTSNNLRDNLTVGYNQDYLVAVWVGNNDNSPMSRIASGLTGASTIWNNIMSTLLVNKPSRDWDVPSGLVQASVCPYTGTLACNGCSNRNEWFLEENQPSYSCNYEALRNNVEIKKAKKHLQTSDSEIVVGL